MTSEQDKQLKTEQQMFDLALIDIAIVEHHRYCMTFKRAKTEKDAKMFYTALKIGAIKGIEYATKKMMEQDKQQEKKDE